MKSKQPQPAPDKLLHQIICALQPEVQYALYLRLQGRPRIQASILAESLTLRMIGRLTGEPIMETSVTCASLTPSISAIDQGGDDILDLAHMADGILSGYYQDSVHIVVQHPAELLQVYPTEGLRYGLRYSAGQGVRVPRPIPLHNFNCWRNGNHKNSSV